MPEEPSNPYASPSRATTLNEKPERGHDRMSETQLKIAIRLMIACELTFAAGWLFLLAIMLDPNGVEYGLRRLMTFGTIGSFMLAWGFTVSLMFHCRSVGMLLIALILPVPMLGSLAFLGCIQFARRTLVFNGYAPGFLSAVPDSAERTAMDADPLYRPNLHFDRRGEYRKLAVSLTHILMVLLLLGFIALNVLR